jgi:hypothetical protein
MPDLTVHTALMCASSASYERAVQGNTGMYRVAFERLPPESATVFGWVCECKGFMYRGACAHIERVKALRVGGRCGWNDEMEPAAEAAEKDGAPCCPDCGGEVVTVEVGA